MKTIKGPVIPIPTPFYEDENIDFESLSSYVSKLVDLGIKNIMTTVGTSRYNLLSIEECKKVNETVVKSCKNKSVSIVANPIYGGTKHAIDFGNHAEEIGADYYLLYYPERHYGDDNIYNFYKTVANNINISVLIHEMPIRNGVGPGNVQFSIPLLKKLLAIPNIVGFKEEALDNDYSNTILENFPNAVCIGAGGGMSRYLYRDFQRGAQAYLGGLGNFFPEIELEFFNCLQNGDVKKAESIVEKIELDYFKNVIPIGWHPHLKYAIYLQGWLPENERNPMKCLNNEEKKIIESQFKKHNFYL